MSEALKITSLEIENVKKVRAVAFRPAKDGLTVIGGKNGQGKTSILDAIAYALGGEKFRPSGLQNREGMATASIQVTLSNGIVVERSGKNASLKVTDPTGMRAGQKLLDALIEQLALNLPKFLLANDKDKARTLLHTLGIEERLEELDKEEKKAYDERTLAGREADRKKLYAEGLPEFADVPDELLSAAELTAEMTKVLAANAAIVAKRNDIEKLANRKQREEARLADLQTRLAELHKEVARQQELANIAANDYAAAKSEPLPEEQDTSAIQTKLDEMESINSKIRQNKEKSRALDEAEEATKQVAILAEKIEEVRKRRMELLRGVAMPLEGLTVEAGELVYNGAKWDCMSSMEQVLVGISICHAVNPKCGFVLLDKLECFDEEQLKQLNTWMLGIGVQGIATRVSTGDECTIIIEDGLIREDEDTKLNNSVELEEF